MSNVVDRLRGVKSSQAIKVPCRVATTANITLSGEQTIDGVAVVDGDRVLVKNQTTASENGIYECDTGAWDRAPDWDGIGDVVTGTTVRVVSGTAGIGVYVVTTSGTITVGTTSVTIALEATIDPLLVGGGTWTTSANYGGTTDDTIALFVRGSVASPTTSIDAAVIVQKHSSGAHVTAGTVNAAIYASIFKNSATSLARATAVYGEAQDMVGGAGSFVEGGRFHGIGTVADYAAYGVIGLAGGSVDVAFDYLIPVEGWIQNNTSVDRPTVGSFDKNTVAAAFLATGEGTAKSDAGFLTNPYSAEPFRTGFLAAEDSVDDTAFASRAATVVGLDLSKGSQSYAAIIVPNNTMIAARNAANSDNLNILALDGSNTLFVGFGATTVQFVAPSLFTATTAQAVPLLVRSTHDGAAGGPILAIQRFSPSAADNDVGGRLAFDFYNDAVTPEEVRGGIIDLLLVDVSDNTEDAYIRFHTMAGGTLAARAYIGLGLVIGSPTGDDKGAGTINAAGDIYKNDTAYTNPDYVFEKFYRGEIKIFADRDGAANYNGPMPLAQLREHTREHLRLPGITDDGMGIFARGDFVLQSVEELFLHAMDHDERIASLETEVNRLKEAA